VIACQRGAPVSDGAASGVPRPSPALSLSLPLRPQVALWSHRLAWLFHTPLQLWPIPSFNVSLSLPLSFLSVCISPPPPLSLSFYLPRYPFRFYVNNKSCGELQTQTSFFWSSWQHVRLRFDFFWLRPSPYHVLHVRSNIYEGALGSRSVDQDNKVCRYKMFFRILCKALLFLAENNRLYRCQWGFC